MNKLEIALTNPKKRNLLYLKMNKYVDVKDQDECWNWTGNKNELGYGLTSAGRGMGLRAHRVAYCLAFDLILDNAVFMLHKCDNTSCCNPYHLFQGNHKDNCDDMWEKGRGVIPPKPFGEKHHKTKFTEIEAISILNDIRPQWEIANDYGVSEATINRLKTGRSWKQIQTDVERTPVKNRKPLEISKQRTSIGLKKYYENNKSVHAFNPPDNTEFSLDYNNKTISLKELSAKYGVARTTITRFAKNIGLNFRNDGSKFISKEQLIELKQIRKLSQSDIATELGCSIANIQKFTKKWGIYIH